MLTPPFDLGRTYGCANALVEYATTKGLVRSGAGYRQSLNAVQFGRPVLPCDSLELDFTLSTTERGALLDVLMRSKELAFVSAPELLAEGSRADVAASVERARALLRNVSHDAAELMDVVVSLAVVARVAGVASASFARVLGVIWLSPARSWSDVDMLEHLFHETCHQDLLLEDMVHRLFARTRGEMVLDPAATVLSAIRRTPRSYFGAYHGAAVGVYLIWLFRSLGLAERADSLVSNVKTAFEELSAKRQYMTDAGERRLQELRERLDEYV